MGRVVYFTVGGCQVLKPCRGLVSFCFMYLVLCTKSKNKTSLERLKYISNIRTNWQTVQIPRCSLRFLLNAPMSAASTVSVGRLFHSFTILIKKKKEYLKQLTLAGLTYNLKL